MTTSMQHIIATVLYLSIPFVLEWNWDVISLVELESNVFRKLLPLHAVDIIYWSTCPLYIVHAFIKVVICTLPCLVYFLRYRKMNLEEWNFQNENTWKRIQTQQSPMKITFTACVLKLQYKVSTFDYHKSGVLLRDVNHPFRLCPEPRHYV